MFRWKLTSQIATFFSLLLVLPGVLHAQFEPEDAHTSFLFPQLADGGPVGNRWQTSFMFLQSESAHEKERISD